MNTEDWELLELAAKAAGLEGYRTNYAFLGLVKDKRYDNGKFLGYQCWNPLTDDGDALRLAVRLSMLATYSGERFELFQAAYRQCLDEDMKPSEATRGGIVRAAAEIGRRMA